MTARRPTPQWQVLSRAAGLTIVAAVMVGWFLGLSISDPGVLALLGIASWLLGINAAVSLKRNGSQPPSSTPPSSSPPSDSSSPE